MLLVQHDIRLQGDLADRDLDEIPAAPLRHLISLLPFVVLIWLGSTTTWRIQTSRTSPSTIREREVRLGLQDGAPKEREWRRALLAKSKGVGWLVDDQLCSWISPSDLGNPGWGWTDIMPYFQRIERMHLPSDPTRTALSTEYIQPSLRGTSGMIHTSWQTDAFSWAQETWPKQSRAMGYPTSTDPRTGTSLGLFNQLTCVDPKDGTRSYVATSYLVAAEGRKNLTVMTESVVNKILWDISGPKPKAVGVEISKDGTTIPLKATKEVLLSSGTIQSPQLLELSGIGDPTLLQTHKIPLVLSNPSVGENLQEHPMVPLSWTAKPGHPTAEHLRDDPSLLTQAMDTYAKTGAGPMAAAVTTTGFLDLKSVRLPGTDWSALATPNTHLPQRQLDLLMTQLEDKKEAVYQVSALPSGATPSARGIGNSAMFFHSVPGNYFSMSCGLMHAFSRGSVHIKSSDVHDNPENDPRYLSHPMDVELLAHSLFHMKEVVKTPP